MERGSFLDAQLWMRKLPAAEFTWTTTRFTESNTNTTSEYQVVPLLPPLALPQPLETAEESRIRGSLRAWGCFHLGKRYCFFRATDAQKDQTQLELELMQVKRRHCTVMKTTGSENGQDRAGRQVARFLVRFDKESVYEIDITQIKKIVFPVTLNSQQQRKDTPPFGCLEFECVSLRVWMDPQGFSHADARELLINVLQTIQEAQCASQTIPPAEKEIQFDGKNLGLWRTSLRYNPWARIHRQEDSSQPIEIRPSVLLCDARKIMTNDADLKATEIVLDKIARARSNVLIRKRPRGQSTDDDNVTNSIDEHSVQEYEEPFSKREIITLATELVHVLGDDHDGVNRLLGFLAARKCLAHDHCVLLGGESIAFMNDECVSSRWNSWDEYLQHSKVGFSNEQSSTLADSARVTNEAHESIQKAAIAMNHAIINEEDVIQWTRMAELQQNQIQKYEQIAFLSYYSTSDNNPSDRTINSKRDDDGPSREMTAKKRKHDDSPQIPRQQETVEQMFEFLLEKRKQLIRDELALSLLPRRHQVSPMD